MHLQFAYYESSLVVEYLIQKYGLDHLKAILTDLGAGEEINKTIAKHTAPIDDLEKDFAAFVRQRAERLAPALDWQKPKLRDFAEAKTSVGMRPPIELESGSKPAGIDTNHPGPPDRKLGVDMMADPTETASSWINSHPTNYYALMEKAKSLIGQKEYRAAEQPLKTLVELYPTQTGADSAYAMLVLTYRSLGETNAEREVLEKYAQQDAEANEAFLRLAELCESKGDWPAVVRNAERSLAVDPLVSPPYRLLAQASQRTGEVSMAIRSNRALLELDPPNPAQVHFRLAEAMQRAGDPAAKRQVLQALEEAPRFQQALQLLLKLEAIPPPVRSQTPPPAEGRP
jgi:tetratricopeptide (TPR) repeat protein